MIGPAATRAWPQVKQPVDYVNPNIGGVSHLLQATSATVGLSYAMVRILPITNPGLTDRYLADRIYGFPAAGLVLMPTIGPVETDPARYSSEFDRDFETASPYYGLEVLDKYDITVDFTAGNRAMFYRFAFRKRALRTFCAPAGPEGRSTRPGQRRSPGTPTGEA